MTTSAWIRPPRGGRRARRWAAVLLPLALVGATTPAAHAAPAPPITTCPIGERYPWPVTAGRDGNVCFASQTSYPLVDWIGRITPAGAITEFPTPGGFTDPRGIAAGADGDLWFAESNSKAVGRLRLPHAVRTVGVFRSGTWYLRNTLSTGPSQVRFTFGTSGDRPLRFRTR